MEEDDDDEVDEDPYLVNPNHRHVADSDDDDEAEDSDGEDDDDDEESSDADEKSTDDGKAKESAKHKTVYVRRGSFVAPVDVEIGTSDGAVTEIVGGQLKAGDVVVLGESLDEPIADAGTNPFGPPQFGRGKGTRKKGGL